MKADVKALANDDDRSRSGFALLIVVAFLIVVAAILAPLMVAVRTEFLVSRNTLEKDRLETLADGLLIVLARELASPVDEPANTELLKNSQQMRCETNGLVIDATIQDQRGLVDLNQAPEPLLQAGFEAAGLPQAQAARFASAVAAYRQAADEDSEELVGDPTLFFEGLKRAPFEALEELYDLKVMAKTPRRLLSQVFTIRSGRPTIIGTLLSAPLAEILPESPSSAHPYIAEDDGAGKIFHIEVRVRRTGLLQNGYAGGLYTAPGDATGSFGLVERTTDPELLPGDAPFSIGMDCATLFGNGVAAVLARAGN